jgi:hypothetical protein
VEGKLGVRGACADEACDGQVTPAISAARKPTYWLRPSSAGRAWWVTRKPPVAPRERRSRVGYRCTTCGRTYGLVEVVDADESPAAEVARVRPVR